MNYRTENGLTIIAATTRPEQLEPAFRSRFFLRLHIPHYSTQDLRDLVQHFAGQEIRRDWLDVYAGAAAGNPRQAERIVATAKALDTFDPSTVLAACRITADGLTDDHLDYLRVLDEAKRPLGLQQIAYLISQDIDTVREVETHLIRHMKLVELTSAGRTLTRLGQRYVAALKEE